MTRRYFYLLLLCLLAIITYLDRVCISVAGPRMQDALHIAPQQWGWVGTVFLIGYALFEIPSGHLGDRIGARRVLARIVLWWSFFTALTGAVPIYPVLLGVRFLFGAGEAGAFPNASVAISRWFAPENRGRAFGLFTMSSQIGGALSPLLVIPIQQNFGWRVSFYVFGFLGVIWSIVWYWKFRDYPAGAARPSSPAHLSWEPILRSPNVWAIMALSFGYVYTMGFYQTWIHTYLVKGRGFSEQQLALSALPYVCGAVSNLLGGLTCDWLATIIGVKASRRAVGVSGGVLSSISLIGLIFATSPLAIIACLSLAYTGITFQQPAVFTTCVDIGGIRGGVVVGFMNTASQVGAALSSVVFGYIVHSTGSYNAPLIPMIALLAVGIPLWMRVDVTERLAYTTSSRLQSAA